MQASGFGVDNDNKLAPENIPIHVDEEPIISVLYPGQEWGWGGVDHFKNAGGRRTPAMLIGFTGQALMGLTLQPM